MFLLSLQQKMNQDLASLKEGEEVHLCFHRRGHSLVIMKYTFAHLFFLFLPFNEIYIWPDLKVLIMCRRCCHLLLHRFLEVHLLFITCLIGGKKYWKYDTWVVLHFPEHSLAPIQNPGQNLVSRFTRCSCIFKTQLKMENKLRHICSNTVRQPWWKPIMVLRQKNNKTKNKVGCHSEGLVAS